MSKYILFVALIFFSTLGLPEAEILDIEEVIPLISLQDSIIEKYRVNLDKDFYYSERNSEYLAITTEDNDNSEVMIFNWENQIQRMDNVYFSSFIPGLNGYCVSTSNQDFTYNYKIFDFSGDLLNSFSGVWSYLTPGGKYIYTMSAGGSWRPLKIYDNNMNQLYKFPLKPNYIANALSDSLIMTVEEDLVSLWDIDHKSIIWKIDFPESSLYVDDYFGIKFSPSRQIALIRNMHVSHFVSINGTILWSTNDYNGGYKIGISASDTLISFVSGGYSHLVFILYSISGQKLSEADNYIGPDLSAASVWGLDVYVNEKFQMTRFTAKNIYTKEKLYLTGICNRDDDGYTVFAVDGFWYYLEKDEQEGTLVGFKNGQSEIVGYSVIFK
jgi:hypothetical protein